MNEPAYPRPYGSYTLLERLGAGGMSEVDLARRTVGDAAFVRFLVIKRIRAGNQIDEQYVRMFRDEARINAELSHENIAQVYDFGREGDEFYMAMEYVPGLDLRAVQIALAKRGKLLPVRIALTILCGVLRALQYAHTRADQLGKPMNIVHRDVNPRNVMLSVHGEVKLIDFGVAKASDRLEKTEGNAVKGKFAYMAPEQIDGNAAIDGRADLFAVALCYHELLTGRSPFAGLTEVQILHRILSGKIPPLPDGIDHPDLPLLRRIHARGLAIRPYDRYPTADAFRADLELALSPIGGVAPPMWIAQLLREAAGDGVEDITRRLRSYRDGAATGPAPIVAPAPLSEASGTLNVASIEAPPAGPSWLAWAAAGVGFSGVLLIGLGVLGAAAAWWFWPTAPDPVVVEAPAAVPTPAPTEESTPAPGVPAPAAAPEATTAPGPGSGKGPATTALPTPPSATAATTPAPTPAASAPATSTATTSASTAGASAAVATSAPPPAAPVAPPPEAAPATVAPTPAPTADTKVSHGFLNLTSRPLKMDVYIDGAKVGATPLRLHRIPAGRHEVAVRDPVTGKSETRTVEVGPDAVVTAPAVILE